MDLCPYDETPLDIIGKKFYPGIDRYAVANVNLATIVYVRVFFRCPTCGKHFHAWMDSFQSEALPSH